MGNDFLVLVTLRERNVCGAVTDDAIAMWTKMLQDSDEQSLEGVQDDVDGCAAMNA